MTHHYRFDWFFRRSPFGGKYTVFAGLEECIRFNANFKFTAEDIEFLRTALPDKSREKLPPLKDIRDHCMKQLEQMRPDHMRRLNPTPYKVSVSAKLYDFIHFLWLNEAPVGEFQ